MTLREIVLKTLKDNHGEWVSGEALSKTLDVSRTTIWKLIKTLTEEGYPVESSPKKGYRMVNQINLLSPEEVRPGLLTKLFGQVKYLYFREIDSTNKRARILAGEGYPEGTLIVAEKQTGGRGRRGRSWYSPSNKGLYMSVILRPDFPLKQLSRLPLLSAVAIAEALKAELNLQPQIKWPNDVLINNKKIAGILCEAVTDMDKIEYVVIGIGINVNNQLQEFPGDFRTPATSVLAENHNPASRITILQKLLLSLEEQYNLLQKDTFAPTLEKARRLSLVIGQEIRFEEGNKVLTGKAIDIDENGFLLVRDHNNSIHTVMSGEINVLL